jgi:hypothetical protein
LNFANTSLQHFAKSNGFCKTHVIMCD